ncbi:GNAT family N-acetyltransferase [Labrenzia sp. PHM005]|uniref:GNAT family N-acetyltransferase n=1 Tax=Labrenzia sp. PHM005 TaxID=2590016 RepID=UPI00113FD7A4|nr:GNAT family N-acetyltransferase [Labrenzia sp. PHM005]QDG76960.1 GNAT family N-acetyltransferase [Labrenzia sp. PHM005]
MTGYSIFSVDTVQDLEDLKGLFRAYVDWLGIDLSYQGFEEELASLPGKYAAPNGALLLAKNDKGESLGCVGLRPFGEAGSCEMKRLYVVPEARGLGVGAGLVQRIMKLARNAGYTDMKLDTLPTMTGAIKLYKQAGFEEIPAYYETPIRETVFFQCVL